MRLKREGPTSKKPLPENICNNHFYQKFIIQITYYFKYNKNLNTIISFLTYKLIYLRLSKLLVPTIIYMKY